jgi:hypothetical protein
MRFILSDFQGRFDPESFSLQLANQQVLRQAFLADHAKSSLLTAANHSSGQAWRNLSKVRN